MKYAFIKPKEQLEKRNFWLQYLKSGNFQESIPQFNPQERPQDGDFRLHKDTIYQYNAENNKYYEWAKVFNKDERPENNALRVHKNGIYRYDAVKNRYYKIYEFPSHFLSRGPEKEPSPFEAKFWSQMAKNIPKGLANLFHMAVGGGALRKGSQGEMDVERIIKSRIKKEGMHPLVAAGLTATEFAGAPFIMAYNAIRHPFRTLRERPIEFILGALTLIGGANYATNKITEYTAKRYISGGGLHDLINSIPDEALAKFGEPTQIKNKVINEIPKDAKIPLRPVPRKNISYRGTPEIGIKPLREIIKERKQVPLKEKPISKGLESLTEEVKKYKSASAFVKDFYDKERFFLSDNLEWKKSLKGFEDLAGGDKKFAQYGNWFIEDNPIYKESPLGAKVRYHIHDEKGNVVSAATTIPQAMATIEKWGGITKSQLKDFYSEALKKQIKPKLQPVAKPKMNEADILKEAYKRIEQAKELEPQHIEALKKAGVKYTLGKLGIAEGAIESKLTEGLKTTPSMPSKETKLYAGLPIEGVVENAVNRLIDISRPSRLGQFVMKKIFDRRVKIAKGTLEAQNTINKLTEGLTKEEREAIPYLREKISDPSILKKIGKEKLISVIKNPSPKVRNALKQLGKIYEEDWDFMRKHYDAENYVENYVTHIWDIPKNKRGNIIDYFRRRNPFLKKKIFPTLEAGIKEGLKPKTTDIKELLRIYERYKHEVAANVELANILKNLPDEMGNPIITTKKPDSSLGYERMEHPVFGANRTAWVHPEVANELKIIWERPQTSKLQSAYDIVNAFLKYSQLSLTLFHHGALSESALGAGLGIKGIAKVWAEGLYRTKKGMPPKFFENMELAKDAVTHGVRLQPSPDVQVKILEDFFKSVESKLPKAPKVAFKGLHKGWTLWNRFLWDHMHNNYKVMAYEKAVEQALKANRKLVKKEYGREMTPEEIRLTKKTVGQFINDSFGGQNWDFHRILGQPRMRRAMQRLILAPDWTVSVLRQASSLLRGPAKMKLGRQLIKAGEHELGLSKLLEGKALTSVAYRYWARMAAYFMLITQAVNLYTTKKLEGKAKFTWENDPGAEYRILVGIGKVGRNIKGEPKIYLRFGKQFTEPLRYFLEPSRIIGGKLSPLMRTFVRQISKHDPGTGWPTTYAEEESFWERIKDIASAPIPFSLKGYLLHKGPGQFLLMFPLMKGMTPNKTRDQFKKALDIKDEKKRQARLERIAMAAQENGLNWTKILKEAEAGKRTKVLWDKRDYLNKIRKELSLLDNIEAKIDLLHAYKERKALTPQEARRLATELEDKQLALTRMKQLDEEIAFVKRIAGDEYRDAKMAYDNMRDEYQATRTEIIMLLRKNNNKKALQILKEHNKKIKTMAQEFAEIVNKPLPTILQSNLYKRFYITPSDYRRFIIDSKRQRKMMPAEELLGSKIK